MSTSSHRRVSRPLAGALAAGALVSATVLVAGSTSAWALSCVEPSAVAAEHPHLFTARAVAVDGDRYLLAPIAQRPGDPVPAKVWVRVDLPEWLFWEQSGSSPVGTDRVLLVAADADWVTSACALWEASEYDAEWIAPVADQVTEPVLQTSGEDEGGFPGNSPTPSHSPAVLAGAAGAGTALGSVVLLGALRRRRR